MSAFRASRTRCAPATALRTAVLATALVPCVLASVLTSCGGAGSDTPTTPPGGASARLDRVTITGAPSGAAAGDTVTLSATATTGSGATAPDVSLTWQLADTSAATFLAAGGPAATLSTGNAATATVRLRKAGSVGITVTAATTSGTSATASTTASFTVAAPRVAPALVRLALSPRAVSARYGVWTSVTATVTDALGNSANVPVTWTPIPHDGERFAGTAPVQVTVPSVSDGSPAPTRTAQVLGIYPTTTRVVATAQPTTAGGQPVSDTLTLRVLDRPAAGLTASTWAGAMLPGATQALTVAATDSAGRSTTLPDGLTYRSSNPGVVAVAANGVLTAVAAGQATITVTAPAGQTVYGAQALQAMTGLAVVATAPFAIDARYVGAGAAGAYALQVQRAVARAVDRWRTLVIQGGSATPVSLAAGACGDASPAINETVPSLLVFVELGTIPNAGVAAVGGPCVVRSGSTGLPVVGSILIDTTRLVGQSDDGVATVMTHEIGHVLGFGTLWNGPRAAALVTGTGTADPRYVGANGVAAWQAAGGARVGGAGVPLDPVAAGGLVAHWRAASFGNEVMLVANDSPTGRAPASAITLGVLADFGYAVAPGDADPYQVPSGASADRMATAARGPDADALTATLAVDAAGRVHRLTTADIPGRLAVPRLAVRHMIPRGPAIPSDRR